MKGRNLITINGRSYDAITGVPTSFSTAEIKPSAQSSKQLPAINGPQKIGIARDTITHSGLHQRPQKSQTLHRAAIKKPVLGNNKLSDTRSPAISRFAARVTKPLIQQTQPVPTRIAPQPSITVPAATVPAKPDQVRSSKELKEALIRERLAEATTNDQKIKAATKKRFFAAHSKLTAVMTSILAVLLLGGYLTYLNLPNISLRVAAARSGIAANLPSYKPSGYSLRGPIAYTTDEISFNFSSKSETSNYTIKQKKSNWDSQAVLDNLVNKQTKSYLTYQEQGLTIYSFDNKAAWVNGGLLYTIEGNAQLSSDQILRIASSM